MSDYRDILGYYVQGLVTKEYPLANWMDHLVDLNPKYNMFYCKASLGYYVRDLVTKEVPQEVMVEKIVMLPPQIIEREERKPDRDKI